MTIFVTTAATTPLSTPAAPTACEARTTAAHENAAVTALLTSLFAGTRLFTGDDITSARAAYQDALYGRAVLVDLRPAPARAADGELGLDAFTFDSDHGRPAAAVRRIAESTPVVLISSDGVLAARIAAQLRGLGLTWVNAVDGGFAAWRSAGLPIQRSLAA